MNREESRAAGCAALRSGHAPEDRALLREITAGMDSLTDFLAKQYLKTYIPAGGSKLKLVTGNSGSGKTHFIRRMQGEAEKCGFITVFFSARDVWMHDFREVYLEILRQCDIMTVLRGCADAIIRSMGYDPEEIPAGKNFLDLLSEKGEGDALSRNEIRGQLRKMFTRNPLLDNTFAACCSLLTGGILGHPLLENSSREMILAYMRGDKAVKMAQLRMLGLAPSPVTKLNARYLLRSLCEVIHLAGYPGLLVAADDMETLLNRNPEDRIHYTRLRREDTYESIRQLIDDIDSMRYVLLMLGFDRELMDNESFGMKSYQALWMRVQNEIVSTRFNRFADIIDMDRYGDEFYPPEVLAEMSRRLAKVLSEEGGEPVRPLTETEAAELQGRAVFGRLGLPYMMNRMTLEGGNADA